MTTSTFVTIETTTCCTCGVPFGIPDYFMKRKRETGEGFYCPNGHNLFFSKPEVQRLRDELIREKSAREQAETRANEFKEESLKLGGKLNRLHKRVRNGVCPCCKRHFANLQNHMKTKHKID
jgi:hypothetical protein